MYYFGDPEIEPDFLANVALLLRLSMFCPREYIPCTNLTIIERGARVPADAPTESDTSSPLDA